MEFSPVEIVNLINSRSPHGSFSVFVQLNDSIGVKLTRNMDSGQKLLERLMELFTKMKYIMDILLKLFLLLVNVLDPDIIVVMKMN